MTASRLSNVTHDQTLALLGKACFTTSQGGCVNSNGGSFFMDGGANSLDGCCCCTQYEAYFQFKAGFDLKTGNLSMSSSEV